MKFSGNGSGIKLRYKREALLLWTIPFVIFIIFGISLLIYTNLMSQSLIVSTDDTLSQASMVEIDIPDGATTKDIAQILKDKGIINSTFTFRVVSRLSKFDGKYKKGIHTVNNQMNYMQLCETLCKQGRRKPGERVTIIEGLTTDEIINELESKRYVDRNKFINALDNGKYNYKFLNGLQPKEGRKYMLEGYLFPDTYEFDNTYDERKIIDAMLSRFDEIFEQQYYERAKQLNMTVDEIITLASIIEREAQAASERTIISSVFHNRLNSSQNKRLESCATVQFALGINKKRLSTQDTKVDSPYNTYIHDGLPIGPICSPGKHSIYAALYPSDTDYLYFAADGNGTHVFSKTLREHDNAVNRIMANER